MPTSHMLGVVSELAAAQHGVVTRSQAADIGIARYGVSALLRRGFWRETTPGVLIVRSVPSTWQQQICAATLALKGGAVASHASAARLHRLDGFLDTSQLVVTVDRGQRLRRAGITVHQVAVPIVARDLIAVGGVRATGLARTIVDLASTDSRMSVERAIDDFERRGASLYWLEETARRLHRPGFSGSNVVLTDLAKRSRRGRVRGSWFQKLVAECLRSSLLPDLVEEFEIRLPSGPLVARVDLALPCVRLAIEAHSRQFHFGASAEQADERRDGRLAELGWEVCYVGHAEVTSRPHDVRRHVERVVARRAADLGVDLACRRGPGGAARVSATSEEQRKRGLSA